LVLGKPRIDHDGAAVLAEVEIVRAHGHLLFAEAEKPSDIDDEGLDFAFRIDDHVSDVADIVTVCDSDGSSAVENVEEILEGLIAELEAMDSLTEDSRKPVELDQTTQGRLSRMDALAAQQMAAAGERRARAQIQRLKAALRRVEDGSYGDCLDCGEAIAPGRLQADPAATCCIACASRRETG